MRNFCIVYFIAVGVIYTIGFAFIARFPIDRQSHQENLRKLVAEAALGLADEPPAPTV